MLLKYTPEIDTSTLALHILSDTSGGLKWPQSILLMITGGGAQGKALLRFQVGAEVPHLMLRLGQVWDTLQVYWQALVGSCLSVSSKYENQLNYQVLTNCTILLKCDSDLRYLPIPMCNPPDAIYVPSKLLKHFLMCIIQHGFWDLLALPHSIWDQQGMHCVWVSKWVITHSHVSILTTPWFSSALHFASSSVLHHVEHHGLESRWHASNSSLWNTVPRRCAFLSQSHYLNLQVHLNEATFLLNTGHQVSGLAA